MRAAIIAFVAACGWVQNQASLPAAWPWLLGALAAGLAAVILPRARPVLAVLVALALGVAHAGWQAQLRLQGQLPAELEQQTLAIGGHVIGLPQAMRHGTRLRLVVDAAPPGVPDLLSLADYQRPARVDWQPGQRWRLQVRLKRPHGLSNPGGSDFEGWLLAEGVGATGSIAAAGRELLPHPATDFQSRIDRVRASIAADIRAALPGRPYAEVLVALVVGEQGGISQAQWQLFRQSGITHLVSISGLHVTMVAGLCGGLLGWLWRRSSACTGRLPARKAGLVAALLAALAYALLAGFQIPTQRTLFMLAVAALALLNGRRLAVSRIWALALGVTVLLDPWAVRSPGFWLSFLTVGALLWALAGRLQNGRGGQAWLRELGASQWAATLGSMPLLLMLFQQLPLASPLANAVAIPLVSMLVTPLALLGALLATLGAGGVLLVWAHGLLQAGMLALQPLAGSSLLWNQAAPPAWAILPAALAAACWLLPRGVPGKAVAALLCLPLAWPRLPTLAAGDFNAVVWDVGQGTAVLVRTASHSLLYDAGPESGGRMLAGALRSVGVERLDTLMLSHDDGDHLDGAGAVLAALPVAGLLGVAPRPALAGQPDFPLPPRQDCRAGQRWEWDGVQFEMLWPVPPLPAQAGDNAWSCVLRISGRGGHLLLTGDIGKGEEARLLAAGVALGSDVMLMPHHGSASSSSPAFIQAVAPRLAIATAGYLNQHRHPRPEVVARYRAMDAEVWRSDRDGAILLDFSAHGWGAQAWRGLYRRYWHAGRDQLEAPSRLAVTKR